jgi:hypothetical protein
MPWPKPVEALWRDLEGVRAELLREVETLSQRQAEWRPTARDWSAGEVIDHLTMAEIATGKLTTKLTRETVPTGFPPDLTEFAALPALTMAGVEAPPSMWPAHGKPFAELLATMRATRERSRQSFDRLAACDPRPLRFTHFRFGELDLAQWWRLVGDHDRMHLGQVRDIRRASGFPAA